MPLKLNDIGFEYSIFYLNYSILQYCPLIKIIQKIIFKIYSESKDKFGKDDSCNKNQVTNFEKYKL
jgi:hypothetical protein